MKQWQQLLAGFAKRVRQLANGTQIVTAWLGSGGKPVPTVQANSRALACKGCVYNSPVEWDSWVKEGLGETILAAERLRHDCSFQTILDDDLGECAMCACYLKLKVWCPLSFIQSHTTKDEANAFPAHCWIRKEIEKQ